MPTFLEEEEEAAAAGDHDLLYHLTEVIFAPQAAMRSFSDISF